MSLHPSERLVDSPAWAEAPPRLSVLIPFFRDDPAPLLAALAREADELGSRVEVVILNDGSGDPALDARMAEAVAAWTAPARYVSLSANAGRSDGRNRLAAHARGAHLLFLDSDMLPDAPDFLARWLWSAEADTPVAFGGFSLKQASTAREFALHRASALRSDCAGAELRALQPEKYVFTSNLLVRRDVFEAERFDGGFSGWGWEDVEWGLRVARRWPVAHLDNPATHLGLDTAERLLGKAEQSAANFARVLAAHGERVRAYPSYRAARQMKRLPMRPLLRRALRAFVAADALPAKPRAFGLRLYRAALYADVV